MEFSLEISNISRIRVPARRFFVLAGTRALETVKFARDAKGSKRVETERCTASLAFVPEVAIQKLNRDWRKKNRPTDVLSFPNFAPYLGKKPLKTAKLGKIVPISDPDSVVRLGDIAIAPGVVRKEAGKFGHAVEEHYIFLFIHGMLHLLGYDHERSEKDEKEMFRLQTAILNQVIKR